MYVYIAAAVTAVCMIFGGAVTYIVSKKRRMNRAVPPLMAAGIGMISLAAVCAVYLSIGYHADSEAYSAMAGGDGVSVSSTDCGWFFDGAGTGSALIFYPGAKVEPQAYAPLMKDLADRGVDCFLVDMPANMAILGVDRADEIMDGYSYDSWYIAGHSLGGNAAASYCAGAPGKTDGLILLASYSSNKLADDLDVLSVYGSEDGVLSMDIYNADKENLPAGADEVVISGGNHSQFGNYGEQRGDLKASISSAQQRSLTVDAIIGLIASDGK